LTASTHLGYRPAHRRIHARRPTGGLGHGANDSVAVGGRRRRHEPHARVAAFDPILPVTEPDGERRVNALRERDGDRFELKRF
jgi:hypothetical protein